MMVGVWANSTADDSTIGDISLPVADLRSAATKKK